MAHSINVMMLIYLFIWITISTNVVFSVQTMDTPAPVRPILVLNGLDREGYKGLLWFLDSLRLFKINNLVGDIYVFHNETDIASETQPVSSETSFHIYHVKYDDSIPQNRDLRIAKVIKQIDCVSQILYSWKYILDLKEVTPGQDNMVLSLAFKTGSIPVVTSLFKHMLEMFALNGEVDLFLLGKNKKLTSLSDWHDLSLVAFRRTSKELQLWMKTFNEVYRYYSTNRKAFNSIDPRFAIMESNTLHRFDIKVGYFIKDEVCSVAIPYDTFFNDEAKGLIADNAHAVVSSKLSQYFKAKEGKSNQSKAKGHRYESSRCGHIYADQFKDHESKSKVASAIEFYCGLPHSQNDENEGRDIPDDEKACLILDVPSDWKKKVDKSIPAHLGELAASSYAELSKNPIKLMWRGLLRFRDTPDPKTPRPFCWENRKNVGPENLVEAFIIDFDRKTRPFNHTNYNHYRTNKSNVSVVMMMGTDAAASTIHYRMYLSISKMYYAKRHGYDFVYTTSTEYEEYFPQDLYQAIKTPAMNSEYFRGIMTKPLMMLDIMHRYAHRDWVVWTDDDVYINTGWLYMPLDAYLADVPADKVIVMTNYRSTFTNVMAIRNNHAGRKLMIDWMAIVMSGYIQCHGFDQAALGALLAQRIGRHDDFPATPLNFTCIYKSEGNMGCNDHNDWSCDFKVERALYRAGFKTSFAPFHNGKISSYSKGCANDYVPDFHIVTETTTRPRFQCGLCTRATEIQSSGHWDGPIGGGNFPILLVSVVYTALKLLMNMSLFMCAILGGNINGWFFNHKAEYLFYETYLKPNACLYVRFDAMKSRPWHNCCIIHIGEVVPPCQQHNLYDHLSPEEHESKLWKEGRHLISLVDGFAFDLDLGTYCKLRNKNIIQHQKEKTYMAQYTDFIRTVAEIPDLKFRHAYQQYEGGEGRHYDSKHAVTDGQERMHTVLERNNYCQDCRVKQDSPFSSIGKVVDCRSKVVEDMENRAHVNTD